MRIRTTKAIGVAAGAAAIALSLPFAGAGHAEPANTGPLPAEIPDPQGPGCDAFKTAVPNWKYLSTLPVAEILHATHAKPQIVEHALGQCHEFAPGSRDRHLAVLPAIPCLLQLRVEQKLETPLRAAVVGPCR